jgi:hypothetical protein
MKTYLTVFSILDDDGNEWISYAMAVTEAQREVSAMASVRLMLAKNGIDDNYLVIFHTVEELSNIKPT